MNDLTREKLDNEISRLQDRLKAMDPTDEKYGVISRQLTVLSTLANKDDESRTKFNIECEKLDAEANLEASKRGLESEKLKMEADIEAAKRELENEKLAMEAQLEAAKREAEADKLRFEQETRKSENRRSYIQIGITSLVTLLTFAGTWAANSRAQWKSEFFESTGHAYTSRFNRWQNKEPSHPNPAVTKK